MRWRSGRRTPHVNPLFLSLCSDCVVLLSEACMHTGTLPQAHFPQRDKLQQLP